MGDGEGGIWREQRKKEREIATGPHMLLSRTTQHADAVRIRTKQCRVQCVRELRKFSGSSSVAGDYSVTKLKRGCGCMRNGEPCMRVFSGRSNFFLENMAGHIYFIERISLSEK